MLYPIESTLGFKRVKKQTIVALMNSSFVGESVDETSYLSFTLGRFQKKVVNMASDLPMHQIALAFLRCRSDKHLNEGHIFKRVLKRVLHWWGQAVEQSLEKLLLSQCPDMTTAARYHPFTRTSRQKGNRTMTLTLVGRFQARPGGYITTKNEDTMHSLGLVSKKSKLAGRTSMEFCVRLLGKAAEFVQNKVAAGLRTLNFCLDAAMVGEESVTWHTDVLG